MPPTPVADTAPSTAPGNRASAPSTVPAVKIAIAMMNRVFVANLRTMNGELGIDTDSNSR